MEGWDSKIKHFTDQLVILIVIGALMIAGGTELVL